MRPALLGLSELSGTKHILSENPLDIGGAGKRNAHEFQPLSLVYRSQTDQHELKPAFGKFHLTYSNTLQKSYRLIRDRYPSCTLMSEFSVRHSSYKPAKNSFSSMYRWIYRTNRPFELQTLQINELKLICLRRTYTLNKTKRSKMSNNAGDFPGKKMAP
jgi:hypothetical protein